MKRTERTPGHERLTLGVDKTAQLDRICGIIMNKILDTRKTWSILPSCSDRNYRYQSAYRQYVACAKVFLIQPHLTFI